MLELINTIGGMMGVITGLVLAPGFAIYYILKTTSEE